MQVKVVMNAQEEPRNNGPEDGAWYQDRDGDFWFFNEDAIICVSNGIFSLRSDDRDRLIEKYRPFRRVTQPFSLHFEP